MAVEENEEHLDAEWIKLIMIAKNIGLTVDEIREFFKSSIGSSNTVDKHPIYSICGLEIAIHLLSYFSQGV